MAFTLTQKKLLTDLDCNPLGFLNLIKAKPEIMDGFKEKFFQNGDGIYHLLFNYISTSQDPIYLTIYKEFFYNSSVDCFQRKRGKADAVLHIIKNSEGTVLKKELAELLYEIMLMNQSLVNVKITSRVSDYDSIHRMESVFKVLSESTEMLDKLIQVAKKNEDNPDLFKSFLKILLSAVSLEKHNEEDFRLFLDSFINNKQILKNVFKNVSFKIKKGAFRSIDSNAQGYLFDTKQYKKIEQLQNHGIGVSHFDSSLIHHGNGIPDLFLTEVDESNIQNDVSDFLCTLDIFDIDYLFNHNIYPWNYAYKAKYKTIGRLIYYSNNELFISILNKFPNPLDKLKIFNSLLSENLNTKELELFVEILQTCNKEIDQLETAENKNRVAEIQYDFLCALKPTDTFGNDNTGLIIKVLGLFKEKGGQGFLNPLILKGRFDQSLFLNREIISFLFTGYKDFYKNRPDELLKLSKEIFSIMEFNQTGQGDVNINKKGLEAISVIYDFYQKESINNKGDFLLLINNQAFKINYPDLLLLLNKQDMDILKNSPEKVRFECNMKKNINPEMVEGYLINLSNLGFNFSFKNVQEIVKFEKRSEVLLRIKDKAKDAFDSLVKCPHTFWLLQSNGEIIKFLKQGNFSLLKEEAEEVLNTIFKEATGDRVMNILKVFFNSVGKSDEIYNNGNNVLHLAIKNNNDYATRYILKQHPSLCLAANNLNKTPIEYIFSKLNYSLKYLTESDIKTKIETFKLVLEAGISKSEKTHRQINTYFEKYPLILESAPDARYLYMQKVINNFDIKEKSMTKKNKI